MIDETCLIVPKKCVTAIETDPPSGSACLFQKLPQLAEEWTMRAL
jgi:predicted metal-binding protein